MKVHCIFPHFHYSTEIKTQLSVRQAKIHSQFNRQMKGNLPNFILVKTHINKYDISAYNLDFANLDMSRRISRPYYWNTVHKIFLSLFFSSLLRIIQKQNSCLYLLISILQRNNFMECISFILSYRCKTHWITLYQRFNQSL